MSMKLNAQWIWNNAASVKDYNAAALFRREFKLGEIKSACLAVTADSWYRLKINGQWVNDGPCRSYPSHFQYDVLDVSAELRPGVNVIEATVRYFGIGTFHQLPQQAGFLAQLEVTGADDRVTVIATDSQWQAAEFPQLRANTAKISIQQEPFELYDATVAAAEFHLATELFAAGQGPWHDLNPRDCRLLSRKEFNLKNFSGAVRTRRNHWSFSIPAQKILYPGNTTSNHSTSLACGVAFSVNSPDARQITFTLDNLQASVNGVPVKDNTAQLQAGDNFLVLLTQNVFTHRKDLSVTIPDATGLRFGNPQELNSSDVCFLRFPEFLFDDQDIPFMGHRPDSHEFCARVNTCFQRILQAWDFASIKDGVMEQLPADVFSQDDAHWHFRDRITEPAGVTDVVEPENMLYVSGDMTTVNPVADRDIELLFDLGEQNCGYWDFELIAAAGTVVDIFAVEYITADGAIQHTGDNRNGLRYVCRNGVNRYTSLKRRSGRYIFITLRQMSTPVKFKFFRLIESTYPVEFKGGFECSDLRLNRIWDISARTMKLCMEDTFTDCPLYEQTLWVGDARNEALFAFPVFGGWDVARRCIRLAGISLEHYPITGCQVPSGWDCLLPAWSFMWGISVWDYYFETADCDFLLEVWPWVEKNLQGAVASIDPVTGLFSMPAWNLFDWSRTNSGFDILIYNSMFMVGAIDAAVKCAEIIGKKDFAAKYLPLREKMSQAIDRTWVSEKQAFPDSLREGNMPSEDIAVHTSMLAILYDIIAAEKFAAAKQNTIAPREEMIKVSSPFASLYYYETLEKLAMDGDILAAIRRDYQPMLDVDASTVWETYATAKLGQQPQFPTRSHCHGWSAAPLMFLSRIVLGVKMVRPGARSFTVSPWVDGMDHASGGRATIHGTIKVSWRIADGVLTIDVIAPHGVEVKYLANATHDGLKVNFNCK